MATKIDALLRRISDSSLRAELAAELRDLRDQASFGLSFERHLPERVRLPRQVVRRGVTVEPRIEGNGPSGVVGRVRDGIAAVAIAGGEQVEARVSDLVVVRDFGQPIYPGFATLGRLSQGGTKPDHVVVRGENFHALEALQYTHLGLVDLIYIDPPYNTGGDLIYNDSYVSGQDAYRHSKWLSFMERRLELAKPLLAETGVILVAIDDNEHAHLKVLMDSIFGESNFLANVTWQGAGKNSGRFGAGGVDYMLAYAVNRLALTESDTRWLTRKPGIDDIEAAAISAWDSSGNNPEVATRALRAWFRALPKEHPARGSKHYNSIDEHGLVYFASDLRNPDPAWDARYDIIHPVTGLPVNMHANGWVYKQATMSEKLAQGRILFGPDEQTRPTYKRYLHETTNQVIPLIVQKDRRAASKALAGAIGPSKFDYPKDVDVLATWINTVTMRKADAVVLDFFGGSGSTLHAVMNLNSLDSGRRQCLLVTNNEVNEKTAASMRRQGLAPGDDEWESQGIFESATRPRITTAVTGERHDGSTGQSLDENVTFLSLEYLDPDEVRRGRSFADVAHLLWLKAGASGPCITEQDGPWSLPAGSTYGALFDVGAWWTFAQAIEEHDKPVGLAYIITDSTSAFAQARKALPPEVKPVHLYENYLTTFTINGLVL